jgi:hypothetical protein
MSVTEIPVSNPIGSFRMVFLIRYQDQQFVPAIEMVVKWRTSLPPDGWKREVLLPTRILPRR